MTPGCLAVGTRAKGSVVGLGLGVSVGEVGLAVALTTGCGTMARNTGGLVMMSTAISKPKRGMKIFSTCDI